MEGFNLARQVENIVFGPAKRENIPTTGVNMGRPLFPVAKILGETTALVQQTSQ